MPMEEALEGADREVAPVRVAEDVELPLDKAEHMVELDRDHAVRREDPGDGGDEGVRVISVRQRVTCDDDASPRAPRSESLGGLRIERRRGDPRVGPATEVRLATEAMDREAVPGEGAAGPRVRHVDIDHDPVRAETGQEEVDWPRRCVGRTACLVSVARNGP